MYEIVGYSFKEIVMVYIAFMSASIVAYPVLSLIYTAVEKGAKK